jgi:hypothetical protein
MMGWKEGYLDAPEQQEQKTQVHQWIEEIMLQLVKAEPNEFPRPTSSATTNTKRLSKKRNSKDATEEQVQKLKMYINKCGIRKPWIKELAGLSSAATIVKLKNILQDLGIEGRPSLSKCAKIREQRERLAELKSLPSSNIILSRTRHHPDSKEKSEVDSTSETPSKSKLCDDDRDSFDLSLYGDPNAD